MWRNWGCFGRVCGCMLILGLLKWANSSLSRNKKSSTEGLLEASTQSDRTRSTGISLGSSNKIIMIYVSVG